MSLWRVKHTLSPLLEKSLIALVLAYGFFAIYYASVRPLVVLSTGEIRSVQTQMSLDTDVWERERNDALNYLYAIPPGWAVNDADPAHLVLASGKGHLLSGKGSQIEIEALPVGDRIQAENVAVTELMGKRPALYDVGVHGRSGLFAVTFKNRRVHEQTVYVEVEDHVLIFRGGSMDPAAFSAFVSTVKFLPS